ncbi:MAG: type II secretion system protein [Phycisphaerae bacterium]|nr:type II secretion system protein [Phycisphaerae bacterium]MDD5380751.1 type II secretion system protein [Phycisphaerae bacterium]
MEERTIRRIKAFTLVEVIVVMSIIVLLMAVLLPSLSRARGRANAVVCTNNLRNLGIAFVCYANDYDDYAMPARVRQANTYTYWWGRVEPDGIDHKAGFVWPYLQSELKKNSVYECPAQRYGSYGLQGKPPGEPDDPKWITSTYGYNGYYLCPPLSGWDEDINIRNRPWQKITTVISPKDVFAFADTLIDMSGSGQTFNTFLLDPPYKYVPQNYGNSWPKNPWPTTCFRHYNKTNVVFVDGHCGSMDLEGAEYASPKAKIGSVGKNNAPHYVPDYRQWPQGPRKRRRR